MEDKKQSVFDVLSSIDCSAHIEKKKQGSTELSYLSWAWAWSICKKHFPNATYTIYESENHIPYFSDGKTCWACLCGLRLSDIEALSWENIRDHRITLKIKKTQRIQFVDLNAQAVELLGERGKGKVFPTLTRDGIARALNRWSDAAGLEKHISFHTSRHTFAVLMLTAGVDIYTVSRLLGHTSVTTTQIYADILDSRRREAVEMLPRI